MTRDDLKTIVAAIKSFYPREAPTIVPTREAFELWYSVLGDIDARIMTNAVKQYVQMPGARFAPTISDLRSLSTPMITGEPEVDFDTILKEITQKVHSVGRYQEDRAMAEMSETAREVAKTFGWQRICDFDGDMGTLNAQIRQIFESVTRRKKREQNLSQDVRSEKQMIMQERLKALTDSAAAKLAIEDKHDG